LQVGNVDMWTVVERGVDNGESERLRFGAPDDCS
jgi:hypothetical protein